MQRVLILFIPSLVSLIACAGGILAGRRCGWRSRIATCIERGNEFEGCGGIAEEVFQVFGTGIFGKASGVFDDLLQGVFIQG